MGMHLYYLNREIDLNVMTTLVELIASENLNSKNISSSNLFKDFVNASFKVKREARPSVSQLSDFFRKYHCNKPGTLATEYAKKLEQLAKQKNINDFWV